MLGEELDRPIRCPVNADLCPAHEAKPVLEADLRAAVEAEQITGKVAEASLAERACEAMRHAERALELRHAQRRRQRDESEVGLSEVDVQIGIVRGVCADTGAATKRRATTVHVRMSVSQPPQLFAAPSVIQRRITSIWPSVRNGPLFARHPLPDNVRRAFQFLHEIAVVGVTRNHEGRAGLARARTPTSCWYDRPSSSTRLLAGVRPWSVWHPQHASRPLESVTLKILF